MSDSIPTDKSHRLQWKTISALGATWLVTTQLTGCGTDDTTPGAQTDVASHGEGASTAPLRPAAGGGEGSGGEGGEGGEGEGAAAGADMAMDDVAYLTQLSLIRGHLAVGYALYQNDLAGLAETHMKHPREEIYTAIEPAFAGRGCAGFAEQLTALTSAVTSRATQPEVSSVYESLTSAIAACESGADTNNPATTAKIIENLLRTAGVEYEIGVIDGAINNLHEYQDAWGFTQIAANWARSSAFAGDPTATAVAGRLQALIASLDGLWPSLNPQGGVRRHGCTVVWSRRLR